MNKSTPISQLPTQVQPNVASVPPPVLNDDDVVVQDILNQINGGTVNESMEQQYQQQQQPMTQQSMHSYYPNPMMTQQMQMPPQMVQPQIQAPPQEIQNYLLYFADDLKLAGLVFTITILVHFIPIDKYVSKYFNIQNIPYHEIILRAIMISLFVVLVKKFAKI